MTAGLAPDEWFPAVGLDGEIDRAANGGIPPWLGSLVVCFVVLIYVFFGGMRGTTWANTFQTHRVYGFGRRDVLCALPTNWVAKNRSWQTCKSSAIDSGVSSATRVEMSKTKFFTYLLIPLSVGMFPHLFQHWMTAKNANAFKLSVTCHPIFIMIVWVPCVLVGVWAWVVWADPIAPPGPPLPSNPNAILPFLVKTQTGPILGGFLAAGILAAIMSSLDSQFLSIGTIFSNDIYVTTRVMKTSVISSRCFLTRMFIIGIVAITYLLSLGNVRSVFALGVWCFSGFSALFPIVVAALYWRGFAAAGAISGIFAAIISWCILFYQGCQVPMPKADSARSCSICHWVVSRTRSCRSW